MLFFSLFLLMLDFAAVPFFFFVDAYQWGVRWCVLGILILRDFFLLDFFLFSFFIHLLSLEKCRFFFFFFNSFRFILIRFKDVYNFIRV